MLIGGKPIEDSGGKNSSVGILIFLNEVIRCCDISLFNKFILFFIIKNQLTDQFIRIDLLIS